VIRALFVFGTRPEAIKLFPVVHAARRRSNWAPVVCVTGQHRQMLDQVLRLAEITPDHDLNVMRPAQDLEHVTTAVLTGTLAIMDQESPDFVIVQGDTTTAMSAALAAFYRRKPIVHVEAGLRSGDLWAPFPEEANRKIVSAIAQHHMAPTQMAADNLRREGIAPDAVHVTGNTVVDALVWMRRRLGANVKPSADLGSDLPRLDPRKRMILVTAHRRENLQGGIERIATALARLADRGDVQILFPVHLNPKVRGPVWEILGNKEGVCLLEPLDYLPFVFLLGKAHLIITDSGGVQEEAPAFGIPVLVMRDKTERPEGVLAGTARLVGSDDDTIVSEASRLLDDPAAYAQMSRSHNPFGDGHAADRILDILEGKSPAPMGSAIQTSCG
jgi:UDP-N-acetylglucosamine 2-epimerase (non-hydrolysing)